MATAALNWLRGIRRSPVSLVYGGIGVVAVLLMVRFIGKLLSVTAFGWLYSLTNPLVAPFKALLKASDKIVPGSQLENFTLLALIIYSISGILLAFALALLTKLNDNTPSKL